MLDTLVRIAPTPRPRLTTEREVKPEEEKFSGFIFSPPTILKSNLQSQYIFRLYSGEIKQKRCFQTYSLEEI